MNSAKVRTQGLVSAFATTFLVVLASPVARQNVVALVQDPPPKTDARGVLRPTTRPYSRRLPPATVSNTPLLNPRQLQEIIDELDSLRIGLAQTLSPNLNYESIAHHAAEIHCRARRLRANLQLTGRPREPETPTVISNLRSEALVNAISQAIQRLVASPAMRQTNVIDAELMANASQDLDLLINNSKHLKQIALSLSTPPETRAAAKTRKTRSPYLQLTTSCWLFTPDFFLKRAAKPGKTSSQAIEGLKVLVKHHKLTAEEPVSLEECWVPNCSITEYEDQHALIVKDFYSYEVAGKVFAYAAVYQIARVKDGKIRDRLNQPVLLYFVDEEGQGVFKLHESEVALNELPGWVTGTGP